MRFKKGDLVKVRKPKDLFNDPYTWAKEMDEYDGLVLEIHKEGPVDRFTLKHPNGEIINSWVFSSRWFETVEDRRI